MNATIDAHKLIESFRTLGDNWDGYGGKPVESSSAWLAQSFDQTIKNVKSIPKAVYVPTSEGFVRAEWHGSNQTIEVTFDANGSMDVVCHHKHPSRTKERIFTSVSSLVEFLDKHFLNTPVR